MSPSIVTTQSSPRYTKAQLLLFLIMVMCFENVVLRYALSTYPTIDEFAHVPAGVSYWELGRFLLYRENPPFIRGLAALPVWLLSPKTDYTRYGSIRRSEWMVGEDFFKVNESRLFSLFLAARCVIIVFATVCGVLLFRWVGTTEGGAAAVVCCALWFSDPSVISNSAIATIDIGTATMFLLATLCYVRFLVRRTWQTILAAGVSLGLALASKFSMLVLYPAFIASALFYRLVISKGSFRHEMGWFKEIRTNSLIVLISLFVLNSTYMFEEVGFTVGEFRFHSRVFAGVEPKNVADPPSRNRFVGTWLAYVPIPLPAHYVLGLDSQKYDEQIGFCVLEDGRLVRRGHWYSPFETAFQKLPIGTVLIVLVASGYTVSTKKTWKSTNSLFLLPAALLAIMLATQTGLNWVYRYLLPCLPLCLVFVAHAIAIAWRNKIMRVGILLCVAANVIELYGTSPFYHSYTNPISKLFDGKHAEFIGSNVDWGQDYRRLEDWAGRNAQRELFILSFYGAPVYTQFTSLNITEMPTSFFRDVAAPAANDAQHEQRDLYWAVSSCLLHEIPVDAFFANGFHCKVILDGNRLKPETAHARIGQSIYIFHLVPDDSTGQTGVALSRT